MQYPFGELGGILVCLVFSGFFSGAETALTTLSQVKVNQMIEENPRWGKVLNHWLNNHTGILTTILIGNNLANITASALAADWASLYFDKNGIPIAIGMMTFLLLFSGEITPKTFARRYAENVALPVMHLVLAFYVVFYPATWIITRFIKVMFWMIGGARQRGTVTEDDIEYIVRLGRREGALDKDKEHLLTSIFDFTDTTAKEIMVPRTDMVTVFVETPYEEVMRVSLDSGFSRIPVKEETIDKVVGIFYTKNLLPAPKAAEKTGFLRKRMRPAVFIPESKKISQVLKMFQKERIHLAIVVNEFGGTEGIVTMEDIVEELLGEIHDEFDSEVDLLEKMQDGSYIADARVDIEELEHTFGLTFPEEREYESLGGFLMEEAGEVPAVGWEHRYQTCILNVTEADVNKVTKVRIKTARYKPNEVAASPPKNNGRTAGAETPPD